MRRLHLTAILVFSLVVIGFAVACQQRQELPSPPDTRAADERAIRQASAASSRAFAAKDVEASVGFYADEALWLAPNAPMQTGKEAIRKASSVMMATPGLALSWQASKVEVSRAGDLAYEVGTYQSTVNDAKGRPVTDRGKYVLVWKKQPDSRWKIVVDVGNSDLPAPGAGKH